MTSRPPGSGFANLEELRIVGVQSADEPLLHLPLGSVALPCLQRAITEVGTETVRWAFLDENLANLVKRHEGCRDLVLQNSTKADPGEVRGLLPQAAQAGVLGVQAPRIFCEYSVTTVLKHNYSSRPPSRYLASSAQPTTPSWNNFSRCLPPLRFSPLPPPNRLLRAAHDQDRIG
jgi:hypothetical protein